MYSAFTIPKDRVKPVPATIMLGAVCGDVAGSIYENRNIKFKLEPDLLIAPGAEFTDDTVMTCAVAEGLRLGLSRAADNFLEDPDAEHVLYRALENSLQVYGNRYPYAGYGGSFRRWLLSSNPQPYNSWGNGSAMRASYAGWIARTLEEAHTLASMSACVTHNHPEGVKGAVAVAGCIFLLRQGATKDEVARYAAQHYDLSFTLDEIRPTYRFDVSCQGSVPQAIKAFLEGVDFADVLSLAISIGGDSDTIAAIAGSIAEVIYPIPEALQQQVLARLDDHLRTSLEDAVAYYHQRQAE